MKLSTHGGTGELAENKLKTKKTGGWTTVRRPAVQSGHEMEIRQVGGFEIQVGDRINKTGVYHLG